MSTYSNVTPEQMAEILANMAKTKKLEVPKHIEIKNAVSPTSPLCKFAEDTGEIAFPRAPCRGNKIICRKIDGHVSFTKACNIQYCKYFEKNSVDDKNL